MSLTYNWEIKSLKKVSTNDINDAIIGTQWKVTATDENGNEGSFDGATPFDLKTIDVNNFTPFEELTQEQVLGWIKNVVSGSSSTNYWDHINGRIQKQIDEKVNVITTLNSQELPWFTGSVDTVPPMPTPPTNV